MGNWGYNPYKWEFLSPYFFRSDGAHLVGITRAKFNGWFYTSGVVWVFLPRRLGHAFCLRGGPKITSYKSRLSSNSTYGGGEISSVTHLGGGFKCFFNFDRGNDPIWPLHTFANGLVKHHQLVNFGGVPSLKPPVRPWKQGRAPLEKEIPSLETSIFKGELFSFRGHTRPG